MFASIITLVVCAAPVGPLAFVQSADAEVQKILQGKDATTEKLAARADDFIDFVELAHRALGKQWDTLKKPQQDDFSATMKGVLRANYAQKALGDGRSNAKITYGDEKVEGNEATVDTTMTVKDDTLPVVYKLYRADPKSGWKIYDVITDDVSLVTTYQDSFNKQIAQKGFDGLLKSLKAKREQLEKKKP